MCKLFKSCKKANNVSWVPDFSEKKDFFWGVQHGQENFQQPLQVMAVMVLKSKVRRR